jgi:hypothetical protein
VKNITLAQRGTSLPSPNSQGKASAEHGRLFGSNLMRFVLRNGVSHTKKNLSSIFSEGLDTEGMFLRGRRCPSIEMMTNHSVMDNSKN